MAITITKRTHATTPALKQSASAVSAVTMATLLLSSWAHAAEWKFTPTVEVAEIYTDNLRLTPRGMENSEFITQISPGLTIEGTGRQLKVKARYEMQNLAYTKQGGTNTNHQFAGDAHAELAKNLFFLDGKAQVSQQTISPFAAQSDSTVNLSNNRTEVRSYSLSPYLQHRFGSTASTELRYTHDAVTTDTGGLLDNESDGIFFSVNSGPSFRTLGWGLHYSQRNTDYDHANSLKTEETAANLYYLLTPRFKLTATAGYEKYNYASLGGEKPEGRFWTGGFSWAPTERTSIAANAGHRFYGKTFSLLANHRTRRTAWSLGYNDDITTSQAQYLIPATTDTSLFLNELWQSSIPDPETRQQIVDSFILDAGLPNTLNHSINTLTNRVFLQKRWLASVAVNGAKNTLLFSVFNTRREAQTSGGVDTALLGAGNLALEDNTHQRGVNALWNWRMSARTSANFSAGYTQAESLATDLRTDTRTYRMALTRNFHRKLKGTLEYRRLQQNFNQPARDLRENAVTASLLMTF